MTLRKLLWFMMLYGLVDGYCGGHMLTLHSGWKNMLKKKAAGSSETFVPIYQIAWYDIPEEIYVLNIIRVLKLKTKHIEICSTDDILCEHTNYNNGANAESFFPCF
jgi:hypothetical protein